MELPVEIIEIILANVSYQDLCRGRRISRKWRDAAVDLLRRSAYKRKTLEERVQFLLFKIQKQAKKSGKKDKILKEDLNAILTYALDTKKLVESPVMSKSPIQVPYALTRLFLYAEDEIGLWDHFDEAIAKIESKFHFIIRSPLLSAYTKIRCQELYELNLDLVNEALNTHANLNLEVDPRNDGRPENAENLVKVFKHYFDNFVPAIKKLNKAALGWFQHIYYKFEDTKPIKAILVMHLFLPSVIMQSLDRSSSKKSKKSMPRPDRTSQYLLLMKIFSTSILGNKHREEFMRGADAYTAEVAQQFEETVKHLMTIDVDPSALFHKVKFSIREIFEALAWAKEFYRDEEKNNLI